MTNREPDAPKPVSEASPDYVIVVNPEGELVSPPADPAERAELRDFFRGLGTGVRRRYRKVVPAPVRTRAGLVTAAAALAIALLAYQTWRERPPAELPIQLQGAWGTTAPSYSDRAFWIGKHQVAFQTGPTREDINVFPVSHLAVKEVRGDTTAYDLEYGARGETSVFSFRHVSLPHPAIVFAHQSNVTWTVTPDLHPPVR